MKIDLDEMSPLLTLMMEIDHENIERERLRAILKILVQGPQYYQGQLEESELNAGLYSLLLTLKGIRSVKHSSPKVSRVAAHIRLSPLSVGSFLWHYGAMYAPTGSQRLCEILNVLDIQLEAAINSVVVAWMLYQKSLELNMSLRDIMLGMQNERFE